MAAETPVCPFLWLDDRLHRADEPAIMAQDRGLLLGDGLFETMRLRGGDAPCLARHLNRLEAGCRILHMPAPLRETVSHALARLMEVNAMADGSARLTLTRGPGPRGLAPPAAPRPTLLLTTAPPPAHAPHPVRLHVSTQRRDRHAVLNRVKSLNALPAILARLEAQEQGADDALWLNREGEIAEATTASFLALMEGRIITPPLSAGILPGISRARLLEAGTCCEQTLHETDLPRLEGAWLVTALSLVPVRQIGSRALPFQPEQTAALRQVLHNPSC